MRRGSASIAANPVLIGAATTLVVIVAVFLAYNANSGLPFVPTYELKTRVPNAANLVKGNEVRSGGSRVWSIASLRSAPGSRASSPGSAAPPSSTSSRANRTASSTGGARRATSTIGASSQ